MSEANEPEPHVAGLWARHFYLPVATERLHILRGLFLLVLAFDIWLELAGHAARYGAGEFNLSHFEWLDAVQPMPTPALYLGVMFGAGLLSFVSALLPQPRWVSALLCCSYTYGWAMSLHDSYQHHYMLSIVLFAFVFFPHPKLDSDKETEPSSSDGEETWAYPMLMTSIAFVYLYAAFAKLDAAWQSGDAFVRVAPKHAQTFFGLGADFGFEKATVLSLIGTSVVGIQVILGTIYLVAPWFDRAIDKTKTKNWLFASAVGVLAVAILLVFEPVRSSSLGESLPELAFVFIAAALASATLRWPWTRWIALFAALSFHFGAEELGLKIGWFSYYMVTIAVFCLGPARLAQTIYGFARDVAVTLSELGFKERGVIAIVLFLCVGGTVGLAEKVDLPGVTLGFAWGAVVLCVDPLRKFGTDGKAAALTAGAIMVAGALMWFSVTNSTVRFDYYRFLGGDLRRRGDLEGALDAYILANRYAPDGNNRKEKENQLRRVLGK